MNGNELLDRIRPIEHRLDNGLTLLVREDHSSPVVAIVTHVSAGYFDEPDPLVGISHVLEHMYFKGTERRGVGEIARQTKAAGGFLNAGTIYDHTSYYTVLPSSAVEMGLEIQADALIHSQIDEEELRKELLVIIQEVNRKLDNPSAMASEKLYEAMFDVHPMRRWRMGTEEALSRLERSDVMEYYRSMYRGLSTTLVVSGDVDPARIIDRVESLYADLPPGDAARLERPEPPRSGARFRELTADVGHSYAELGWRSPGALEEDTPALDALAVVLGQGRASRLYRGVRERGLASDIGAYNYTPRDIGVFGVSLECEPGRTREAVRSAIGEVESVRASGVGEAELERVRTVLESRLLRRLETAQGQANLLAEWEGMGDWRKAGAFLERVRTLDPADLERVAQRYLVPGDVTLLVYRPETSEPVGWREADLPDVLLGRPAEESAPAADLPVESKPVGAPIVLSSPSMEDGVVQYDLGGGRLVVKPRSRAPLVSLAIAASGGSPRETSGNAGITSLAMRTSVKGTATRSAERIALESEGLGGSIGVAAGADRLSWSLTVPSEHFREGFRLLADVAFDPVFPTAEVERERDVLMADLEQLRDDMYRYPLRLLLNAAFDGHPYGTPVEAVEAAVPGLSPEDLRRWHASELAAPWVFVVGDVDPERVAEAASELVRPPTRALPTSDPRPAWPESPAVRSVSRDRAQTALALGFPGPAHTHPDRITLEVLSNAVSGLGNRLFEELRSRRSLAYTVTAYPIARRYGGAFVGYIATSPAQAPEARQALVDELLRLRTEPLSDEELERARQYTLGSWQIRTQTNGAQLSELAQALMLGDGVAEVREFGDRVRAVTAEQVLEAASRWFDPDRLVEGAVHGRGLGARD
jgi:zinc protease